MYDDETALRIMAVEILCLVNKGERTPGQLAGGRRIMEEAIRALRHEAQPAAATA
jgi:hypothetical protein